MQDTKQKILDVSKKLFYRDGYNNTSLRKIADEVGVVNALIFHYFKNKRDILEHIIHEYSENLNLIISSFEELYLLNRIDKMLLKSKIQLIAALGDEKFARLVLDGLNEQILIGDETEHEFVNNVFDNAENNNLEKSFFDIDELFKFRNIFFKGAKISAVSALINREIIFDISNIDAGLIAGFTLFGGVPINELIASLKRIDRILKLLTFNGFDIIVSKDDVSEYLSKNEISIGYDYCKVILMNEIVFTEEEMIDSKISNVNANVEYLKNNYDKVLVLVKNYKVDNLINVNLLKDVSENFASGVLNIYEYLRKDTIDGCMILSHLDADEYQNISIQKFEKYGIAVLNNLKKLKINYLNPPDSIMQCAFIFY